MGKKFWSLYAPVYEKVMQPDRKLYKLMYERIPPVVEGKRVLEVATGPGLLAKHIAPAASEVIATDYAPGMIREAMKGNVPENVRFEVADAKALPYEDVSFDVVLIANALHIMPEAEKALQEAARVLTDDGILIAPNFVEHTANAKSTIWTRLLEVLGVSFEHTWVAEEYRTFLEENGWTVTAFEVERARMSIAYAECVKGRKLRGGGQGALGDRAGSPES